MKQLKNGRGLTDSQMGFLLIVPGLAVFLAIILYPFVDAVITSFTDRSLIYPDYKFVAFANYAKVFKDPYFGKTLITTLLFVLGSTALPYTLGMIWAIDLNQGFKGAEFLRGVTLVNWIIPGTAIGFLWSWIFNGQYGILNSILKALGILKTGIPWLGQTNTALLCVMIAGLIVKSSGLYGAIRDRYEVQKPGEGWERWNTETPGTRIPIGDDIVRIDTVSCSTQRAEVQLTAFDRIPGGVVYARLLHTLRLENERGEVIDEWEDCDYPSCVSSSGTLYVCIASHRVNIEPDDTYIRLIYDRLGEHVALEIPLPGREAQP